MAIDPDNQRLFIAALGNDTVEIVDLATGRRSARLTAVQEPQGLAYSTSLKRLFVASGRTGRVDAFDDHLRAPVGHVGGLEDADNLRYEVRTGRLYVGYAHHLGVLDAATMTLIAQIALAGHPEAFELETAGPRIFVNVPSAQQIAVVDRVLGKVVATWDVGDDRANFPMALDESQHRLIIATRRPATLQVYDTETGQRVARITIAGDADDLFLDHDRQRIYVICGEGVIDVVQRSEGDRYVTLGQVRTAPGARTGLLAAARRMLFVAVPARGALPAEIRSFPIE